MQSSYVTVGNYPGIEARIFGSEGAIKVRLVEEFGVIQTIHTAKPDAVEFVQREIPAKYFPPGFRDRRSLEHRLLRQPRPQLLRGDRERRRGESGQLRAERAGAGDHQRGDAFASGAAVGRPAPRRRLARFRATQPLLT